MVVLTLGLLTLCEVAQAHPYPRVSKVPQPQKVGVANHKIILVFIMKQEFHLQIK